MPSLDTCAPVSAADWRVLKILSWAVVSPGRLAALKAEIWAEPKARIWAVVKAASWGPDKAETLSTANEPRA